MLFGSVLYMIILPAVLIICRLIPKKFRYIWLLAVSLAFYYFENEGFVVLLIASSLLTYVTGLIVGLTKEQIIRKIVSFAGVAISIAILFLYKYLNFSLGLFSSPIRFEFAIPLGISFYSFQAISYMIDVYRDPQKAEKDPLKIMLYLSFFLSIVSGPVNRAEDMIPQFAAPCDMTPERLKEGMQKILWGYFLKLAIAGRLSIIVDNVYSDAGAYPGFAVAFCAISYLFMLYCDFEGYSQIVIGSGYMLGITMKENFRQPFMSSSMAQVWRRWHVSLSSWFRDYVYIPLGGNRRGTVRKYINIFITLFVSGIWHGANFTFFIWGALNGAYIIIGQLTIPVRDKIADKIKDKIASSKQSVRIFDALRLFFKRVGVYLFTAFTFIFFANENVTRAWIAVKRILLSFSLKGSVTGLTTLGLGTYNLALVLVMAIFVLIADSAAFDKNCDTPSLIKNIPTPARWVIYYALIIAILFSANLTGKEFIYSKM